MPFLLPALPFIIGAGASAGAGYLGKKLAGGGNGSKDQQKELLATETEAAKFGLEQQKLLTPKAAEGMEDVQGFWRALLTGDRQKMMEFLQPEVSDILSQYDVSRRQTAEFGPRGSGRTEAMAESRFKQTGDITKLLATGRRAAAGGELEASTALANLGLGQATAGTAAAGTALQALLGEKQISAEKWTSIGQGLGNLLFLLAQGNPGGGGGGGGDSSLFTLLGMTGEEFGPIGG